MTTFERIKDLAKKRDKSLQEIAVELGFSTNIFYKWKTQSPKGADLEKVADYFGVTVDYLLGRSNVPMWATEDHVKELDSFLEESNSSMTYKNKVLTNAQKEKIKKMLEVLFWETGEELGKNEENITKDE